MEASGAPGAWPDYCCVPAFIASGLRRLGVPTVDRRWLCMSLGVKVPSGASNPLGLPSVGDVAQAGVQLAEAKALVPRILTELALPLDFRHIPFNTIPLGDYEGYFASLRDSNCAIGLGLDWRYLHGSVDPSPHVVNVLNYGPQFVSISDPSEGDDPADQCFSATTLEGSVRVIGDGFWLMGRGIA